jgi:hypothetical protein
MMFLDCPANLEEEGARCGLPAEVKCRFTMRSTSGPLESAMIRCSAGHWFNGTIESLTWERTDKHKPRPAAGPPGATHGTGRGTHDGHEGGSRSGTQDFPAVPRREASRPSTAPAYYLGRPAALWIRAMRSRRSVTTASHLMEAVTLADDKRHPGTAARQPPADAAGKVPLTLA